MRTSNKQKFGRRSLGFCCAMGEIEDLKSEIIKLKQALVGYQECMKRCGYLQNLAWSYQMHLTACQGELRAAQASAKSFESKYNAALGIAGTKLSHSTAENTKKRKFDGPTAVAAAKSCATKPQTSTNGKPPPDSGETLPAEKKTEKQPCIVAKPPAEKKKFIAAVPPTFEERFAQLEHFHAGHGHCHVPRKGYKELNGWIHQMRRRYADKQETGVHKFMTEEHIEKLEGIGFQWRIKTKPPVPFETRLVELRKFKKENGHCNVPRKHPSLGEWVHTTRGEYRKKGGLEKARQIPLDDLGFVFESSRKGTSFEERLEQCADWRRRHGHLTIPNLSKGKLGLQAQKEVFTEEEIGLLRWASKARINYRRLQRGEKSSLDRIKVKKLETMGFCWEYVPMPEGTKAQPTVDGCTQAPSKQNEGTQSEEGASDTASDSDAELLETMENDCMS